MPESQARSAVVAAGLAIACAAVMALGVGGAATGLLPGFVGFRIFLLGVLLGLAALAAGLVGLRRTRSAAGRGKAWAGTATGAAALALVALAGAPGFGLPPINDITTDTQDPPVFAAAGRALAYPGEDFARQQRAAYPDLAPLELPVPPAEALARAERAARALGWTRVASDPAAGTLEAQDVTRIFRFVDDVVIRVRPAPGGAGSRVDVRSKSRDGRGDLGANAARIRAFQAALRAPD